MKTIPILLFVVLVTVVIGFWSYIWRSLSSIRRKITHSDLDLERQLCGRSQRVIACGLIGFLVALVIVCLGFPNIQWKYQIALAIVVGLFLGMFVGIATSSKNRNKK